MHFKYHLFNFFLALCWSCFAATAQHISPYLSETHKKYAETIVEVSHFLKSHATPVKKIDTLNTAVDSFYDAIIDKYFDRKRMNIKFSKNTDMFVLEGKIDILRIILNISDTLLDHIPQDSLFIESAKNKNYYELTQVDHINNSMAIAFGAKKLLLLMIWFDEKSEKIILVDAATLSEIDKKSVQKYFTQ